jgi:outer membrane protein assembly factor BamB
MFKRLIIAVLTLGLILAFSSAAISSDAPKIGLNRLETYNPDAPRLNQATAIEHSSATNQKPSNALNALQTPTRVLPPQYVCEYYDYSGGNAAYYWKLTDKYGDSIMGMRYTPKEGYDCTLLTAYVGVYGTAIKGNPGMRVTVYDDDGFGLPGTFRGSVDVLAADLPHSGMYYKDVDLSGLGLVYSNGAEFHIGISKVDDGVSFPDTLAILSDDGTAGLSRSWEYWGVFASFFDDWGLDVNFLLGVDVCCGLIPYTECYRQQYNCGTAYYWRQPDLYGDDYFNMRFDVEGPETLKEIGIVTYRPGSKPWGNPDMDWFVWGDDGAGFPNLLDVKASGTILWANLVHYPSWNIIDLSSLNLVLRETFHVGWSTHELAAGDTLACLSDNGSCGTGRSSEYYGAWGTMLDDWGVDVNFLMYADLCKDEFADCRTLSFFGGDYYYWRYPDRYGDYAFYQLFSPKGEGCRLENVNVRFFWSRLMYTWPLYTTNSELQIWTKDALNYNLPGTKVKSWTVVPADYNAIVPTPSASTRWWKTFDVAADNYLFDADVWVGMESFAPDTLSGFFILSDDGLSGQYRSCEGWGDFGYMLDDWGVDVNFGVTLDVCCVPIAECACAASDDWPMMGRNAARTNHSKASLGDAKCKLTKAWQYTAAQVGVYNSPVIYKDTVVMYFLDRIVALDINDGHLIWQRTSDPLQIGDGCYSTPTIVDGIVYTAGGSTQAFNALKLVDGTTLWSRNYSYHSSHFITFGANVVVDIAGTKVIIYTDDDGYVYAADALTGATYAGWTPNPVIMPGPVNRGVTTDGNLVFIGVDMPALGVDGDIIALNPATGAIVWQLSVPPAGPLQGSAVVPPKDFGGAEGFTAGIAVAAGCDPGNLNDNVLYTASYYDIASNATPVQDGGVFYSINASDGSVNWAVLCQQGNYNIPAVDAAKVIYQDWTPWTSSGVYRGPVGFARSSGNAEWYNTTTNPGTAGLFANMEGVLSCEAEGAADIYTGIYRSNFVNFYDANNGDQIMHRRFTGYLSGLFARAGHRIAPVMDDGHLLLPWRTKLVCMTNQVADRPRLEILNYTINVPVPFDSGNPSRITFADAITNNGCATLTIDSVIIDENSNNTSPALSVALSTVDSERLDRLNGTTDIFNPKTDERWFSYKSEDFRITDEITGKSNLSDNAAYAPPSYFLGLVSPLPGATLAPDAVIPIVLDVDGDAITRGYHVFYAYVYTDDPDYFLDSARIDKDLPIHGGKYAAPQIQLGLIGGCLYASTRLTFGVSSANHEIIYNSGFIANGDSTSMKIGSDGASFWQGCLIFAKSKYRIALHSVNWHGVDGDWKSLLADPNCVDQSCPPLLTNGVLIPVMYSSDLGDNYTTSLSANLVSFAYVDSVQNMDDDTTSAFHWNWAYPRDLSADPPYDDTLTIGFKVCGQALGVVGVADLSYFTVHKYSVTSRYGNPITNLYLGAMIDYDIAPNNKNQINGYDAAHSLSFVYDCVTPTTGWGAVKVPFGCGYTPFLNSKTIEANPGGPWNDSDWFLDSIYTWSQQSGLSHQPSTYPCIQSASDRDAWFTFQKESFSGTTPAIYGFALFGKPGITNANDPATYFPLANLINQFCGFGRGDVNSDGAINLVDIVYLAYYVADPVNHNGPYPFMHLGDVNNDGNVTDADVVFLQNFYFNFGTCPVNDWTF